MHADLRPRRLAASTFAALALTLASACASTPEPAATKPGQGPEANAPLSAAEQGDLGRLFPFPNGHVYAYRVTTETGETRSLTVRTVRVSPGRGELHPMAARVRSFDVTADGVRLAPPDKGWVLKAPLEIGATFAGEHGGKTTVTAVGHTQSAAGETFQGCVTTVEQRGGDRPLSFESVFCPDVGLVRLEASSGSSTELAELESRGPPVDLGPDGVKAIKVEPVK